MTSIIEGSITIVMKNFLFPATILLAVFCVSCIDISDTSSESKLTPKQRPQQQRSLFPLERTLTDSQGRSINATILAKQGLEIIISKDVGGIRKRFVIPFEKLSPNDQEFLSNLASGGNFSFLKKKIQKAASLAGRTARWHMDLTSAERESAKLDLPMLLVVTVTNDPQSEKLESELLYSRNFTNWAGSNLVLCSLKVDDPYSKFKSSITAEENRKSASKYGIISSNKPTILFVKANSSSAFHMRSPMMADSESAIKHLDSLLLGEISAIPQQRSPVIPGNGTNRFPGANSNPNTTSTPPGAPRF